MAIELAAARAATLGLKQVTHGLTIVSPYSRPVGGRPCRATRPFGPLSIGAMNFSPSREAPAAKIVRLCRGIHARSRCCRRRTAAGQSSIVTDIATLLDKSLISQATSTSGAGGSC